MIDITAQKTVEWKLERSLDGERSARLEAEKATRLRDEVLGVLAHDLRSPMNTILAAAQLLALTAETEKRQRQLAIIQRATRTMEVLVNDLLDVGRIEAGTFIVHPERLDIGEAIREAVELIEPQTRARQITLNVTLDDRLPAITADRNRLLQVLSNLLGNALKFTRARTTIHLRAVQCEGGVRVSVEDSGDGIASEHLKHIFDRFWQAERSSRAGAGLGLAICKAIVEAHGGRIWAASAVGRGTTIHFELPEVAPAPPDGAPSPPVS